MRYSSGMKAAIVKRVLPPSDESVSEVSRETGVGTTTIHYWKKQASEGMLDLGDALVRHRYPFGSGVLGDTITAVAFHFVFA